MALVGSHSYGLADEHSDRDYRGVYVAPTRELLGIGKEPPTLTTNEPDSACYELGRFVEFCLAHNPNVMEVLWAEPFIETAVGAALRANRGLFLSERVRATYGGYLRAETKKLTRGLGGTSEPRRRAKAIRHTYRLYEHGMQLLTTGNLTLRVRDPEALRAKEELDDRELAEDLVRLDRKIMNVPTVLPERPDRDSVNDLLVDLRLRELRGEL